MEDDHYYVPHDPICYRLGPVARLITKMSLLQLFDRLREERPGLLEKKVAVLEGDVTQLQLGLSSEAYRLLQKEVSVVFHVAASVRFNEPLPDAALINLRGTREAIHLAAGCKQLKVRKYTVLEKICDTGFATLGLLYFLSGELS